MKNKIEKVIKEILNDMKVEADFVVELPKEISNGDYSTNVAMILSKILKRNPSEIADEIILKIENKKLDEFSSIEKAGPGFINFYLSDEEIQRGIAIPTFKNEILKGKKILFEFTDPNPFKQFHIGHLMTNTIGESLSRIYEANGAEVKRLCYQGDTGLHVAKAIWGITKNKDFFPQDQDPLSDKAKYLGDSYVYGSVQYMEDSEAKDEIDDLNKHLFENKDVDIELQTYYVKGRKWSLEYFDKMYELLGTKFDKFYLETESAPVGLKVIEENTLRPGSGQEGKVFEESDGAVIYDGEKDGLHTRVFVNSKGVPTYETKELGLMLLKKDDFEYDESLVITGNEQDQYFQVVLAAMSKIYPEISSKTKQLGHGMMRFAEGKMGSRTGNVIIAEDLIEQIKKLVKEKVKDRELTKEEKEEIIEKVAISALKYSVLKQSIGKDIIFDFEKSISFEGDSGPYLQYTFVRAKSILEKESGIRNQESGKDWETTVLERLLIQYKDVLEQSLEDLAPQLLVTYLTKLASEFNSFYASEKILDENDPNSGYKISITKAVKDTLQAGLHVLGIEVPSKM
jgi:arginyl-tRNA synthetase